MHSKRWKAQKQVLVRAWNTRWLHLSIHSIEGINSIRIDSVGGRGYFGIIKIHIFTECNTTSNTSLYEWAKTLWNLYDIFLLSVFSLFFFYFPFVCTHEEIHTDTDFQNIKTLRRRQNIKNYRFSSYFFFVRLHLTRNDTEYSVFHCAK